jgi:hypothetical protein
MPTRDRVEVPALCEFEHEGRCYVRGEIVTVPPVVALALARLGRVTLLDHRQLSRGHSSVAVSLQRAALNTRYGRRDMRAED